MVPPTRRRVLQVATGLTAALSGCTGWNSGSAESQAGSPTATEEPKPGAGSETDPAHVKLRSDVDRPPVWLSEPGDDDSERPTPEHDSFHADSIIVDGESRADRVGIADVSGADDARSFLAETDFDTETVYVETIRVQECFRIQLCRISWASDEIHTNYGRTLRPYDEQCGVEERVYVAVFIRIPDALEEESVNSYGSSLGGGGCRAGRGAAGGGGGDASMSSGASSASTGGEDDPTPAETTDAVTRTATNETGGGQ